MRYLALLALSSALVVLAMPARGSAATPALCVQGKTCCPAPAPTPGPPGASTAWRPPPPHACNV